MAKEVSVLGLLLAPAKVGGSIVSDRAVLKAMHRRLCKVIGQTMADGVVLQAKGQVEEAKQANAVAQTLGVELQRLDQLLALRLPSVEGAAEAPAKATWRKRQAPRRISTDEGMAALAEVERLGGEPGRDWVEAVKKALRLPTAAEIRAKAEDLAKQPWPSDPPELRRAVSTVIAWLRSLKD